MHMGFEQLFQRASLSTRLQSRAHSLLAIYMGGSFGLRLGDPAVPTAVGMVSLRLSHIHIDEGRGTTPTPDRVFLKYRSKSETQATSLSVQLPPLAHVYVTTRLSHAADADAPLLPFTSRDAVCNLLPEITGIAGVQPRFLRRMRAGKWLTNMLADVASSGSGSDRRRPRQALRQALESVAAALGHSGGDVTKRSYIDPEVLIRWGTHMGLDAGQIRAEFHSEWRDLVPGPPW